MPSPTASWTFKGTSWQMQTMLIRSITDRLANRQEALLTGQRIIKASPHGR